MPIRLLCPISVRRLTVRSEPQRTGLTEIDPVQSAINPQGRAQPSRAPRQVSQPLGAAISLHDRDALGWLDRPDQDARPTPDVSLETFGMNELL
jgi:hypothetical protein